jgi:uncharacterized protein (DUF1697 family)
MPIYVAMLRGINVGAHKRIKMDQLRRSFEKLGFKQVKTYIQSGNVVFKAKKVAPAKLAAQIEKQIIADFGLSSSVVCRTVGEVGETLQTNPFLNQPSIDREKLHVIFLSEAPTPEGLKKLESLTTAPDQSRCMGKEIYLYLPNGVSGSSLMKTSLERMLSLVTTTRNWRTVSAIHKMCQDCSSC